MKSTTITSALLAMAASANAFVVTEDAGLTCHSAADSISSVSQVYEPGSTVGIVCQTPELWAKTVEGCYIQADTATYEAQTCEDVERGFFLDLRDDISARADNYPYKGSCGGVDPWNFYKCQCTSFCAFRINNRYGINFHNQYKGAHWGNANSWDEAAKATGVTINGNPKAGAIAQSNAGNYGHVAWVLSVSGSQVTIEEYNYAVSEGYGRRTLAASNFNYIHIG
jgi:surface antigen